MEHPECLNLQTEKTSANQFSDDGGGDAITSPDHELPVTLCDKLVCQFLKTLIPLHAVNKAVLRALLRRKNICSKLNLLRVDILSESSLCDIAYNHISSLNLFGCMEYSFENIGIVQLMRNNKENLKNLRVYSVYGDLDGEHGDLEDSASPFYSFLPDPGADRVVDPHSSNNSRLMSGSGRNIVFVRGDYTANQRFTPVPLMKTSNTNKEVTLLHLDGCYRPTKEKHEVDWFRFPNLQSFTVINTDSQSNTPSDLIIWNILVSNPQLTTVCIVSVDVSFWWTKIPKLECLTTLILSCSSSRQHGRPTSFFQYLKGLVNLR